jgi:hypothetical protein
MTLMHSGFSTTGMSVSLIVIEDFFPWITSLGVTKSHYRKAIAWQERCWRLLISIVYYCYTIIITIYIYILKYVVKEEINLLFFKCVQIFYHKTKGKHRTGGSSSSFRWLVCSNGFTWYLFTCPHLLLSYCFIGYILSLFLFAWHFSLPTVAGVLSWGFKRRGVAADGRSGVVRGFWGVRGWRGPTRGSRGSEGRRGPAGGPGGVLVRWGWGRGWPATCHLLISWISILFLWFFI